MSYFVNWLVEDRVVYASASGDMAADAVQDLMQTIVTALTASTDEMVHVIGDLSALGDYPTRLQEMQELTADVLAHPRLGWVLLYGRMDEITQFLATVLATNTRTSLRLIQTRDEALHFLARVDPSLESDLWVGQQDGRSQNGD